LRPTEHCAPELAKMRNIVEMALDFSAMVRVFSKDSKEKIKSKLEEHFKSLAKINTREDYEAFHREFCEWFTGNIWTAERKLKNGKALKSQAASYGHAAKVLDIAIKVYVYYCAQPNAEVAERLVSFLHCAVDRPLMKYLKSACTIIKDVNDAAYQGLQSSVRAESQRCKVHPVQYDDIVWRQLSRGDSPTS
jgi:hypothetical protein